MTVPCVGSRIARRPPEGTIKADRIFVFEDSEDLLVSARGQGPADARELQLKLLPTRPPHIPGFDLDAVSSPAFHVGGDHFNFFAVGGDGVGILLADVSGKGMRAALLASLVRATFRTQTWGNHDVRDVLTRANSFLSRVLPRDTFVTAIYGVLDVKRKTLTFGRAGHEPLALARLGEAVRFLQPAGFPLGLVDEGEFHAGLEVVELNLESGDRVVIFSDGLTEAMNAEQDEFGYARIIRTMSEAHDDEIDALLSASELFCGDVEPHDDLTLVTLRVT